MKIDLSFDEVCSLQAALISARNQSLRMSSMFKNDRGNGANIIAEANQKDADRYNKLLEKLCK